MDVQHLSITNEQATEHISRYSRNNSKEAKCIVTAARAVIEGKVVIDAHDVIRRCLDNNGIPKIAICPVYLKVVPSLCLGWFSHEQFSKHGRMVDF